MKSCVVTGFRFLAHRYCVELSLNHVGTERDNIDKARWHFRACVLSLAALPSVLLPHVHGNRGVWSDARPGLSPRFPHLCRCVCRPLLTVNYSTKKHMLAKISQGNAVTNLRCGGIFHDDFITNLLPMVPHVHVLLIHLI